MDRILKFINSLSPSTRQSVLELVNKITENKLDNLQIKKLKGEKDLYRIRKGKIRLIFKKEEKQNTIVNIDYRNKVYKDL